MRSALRRLPCRFARIAAPPVELRRLAVADPIEPGRFPGTVAVAALVDLTGETLIPKAARPAERRRPWQPEGLPGERVGGVLEDAAELSYRLECGSEAAIVLAVAVATAVPHQ